MIDDRFSAAAFAGLRNDSTAARELADDLAEEVLKAVDSAVRQLVRQVVADLTHLGHDLRPYDNDGLGEVSFRDDRTDSAGGYSCDLRLAVDVVVSTGYDDVVDPDTLE